MTAATQPSIEDLILGALPGAPRMNLHVSPYSEEVLGFTQDEWQSQHLLYSRAIGWSDVGLDNIENGY
jgi:hypothetical protein